MCQELFLIIHELSRFCFTILLLASWIILMNHLYIFITLLFLKIFSFMLIHSNYFAFVTKFNIGLWRYAYLFSFLFRGMIVKWQGSWFRFESSLTPAASFRSDNGLVWFFFNHIILDLVSTYMSGLVWFFFIHFFFQQQNGVRTSAWNWWATFIWFVIL